MSENNLLDCNFSKKGLDMDDGNSLFDGKLFKEKLFKEKDLISLVEITLDGNIGKFIMVNDTLCKRLGYSREELLNMTIYDTKILDKKIIDDYYKKLLTNYRLLFETNIRSREGKIYFSEVSCHLFDFHGERRVLIIARDKTERKTVEKELHETEQRYLKLVELIPDAVHIKYNGRIVFSNEAGAKLFGYKNKEDIIGIKDEEITHADYQEISTIRGNEMRKKNNKVPPIEQKGVRADGQIIDLEIVSTSIPFNGDRAILSVIRDITERKKWEKMLEEALADRNELLIKAIELDKQKTEFFSNISHEFKTPLNVILGCIQLLESFREDIQYCDGHIKAYKHINTMKQNCYRLLRLISNLIDINKADSKFIEANFCNCDIISIVEDITLSVVDFGKNKGIDLIFDTEIEEKIISCDVDKIERIMLNLLSNSIKHTDPGGKIYVNFFDRGENIIISVRDTGIGIPEDKIKVIFKRFEKIDYSLNRKKEGSGIGLSLVKFFVELHGGRVWVESKVGSGTQFFIELPARKIPDDNFNCNYIDYSSYSSNLVERINIEFSDIYS